MIHQYKLGGYNIVLDINSGSVHAVDEVAYDMIAMYETHSADEIVAAMLEKYADTPEVTEAELRLKFSKRIAALVSAATEEKLSGSTGEWQRRKLYAINNLRAATREQMVITLADKLSNLRAIRKDIEVYGEKIWQYFNQPNRTMHKWYYTSVLQGLEPLSESQAYRECIALMEEIFG